MQIANAERAGADRHRRHSRAWRRWYVPASRAIHQRKPDDWLSTLITCLDKPRNHMYRTSDPVCRAGSAKNRCIFLRLRVVRLSPALPGTFARDAPSLSRHHPASVWSQPRPTDISPRASIFASASSFSRLPPSARCPPRPGGQHLASVSGKDPTTEARRRTGRSSPSGGTVLGG